ncbi:MAG: RNA polymerase subunit sigma-70 [Clostridiales bacterium]|jgi:RNA polymerase sigma factor (sigma-70 family)|nr:RNA polymerase subunit sigma-70 [Clostridiales bacterium]MDR1439335.1 RNA polymerase subunit sigma-70 [Clostridiales bacterium]
MQNWQKDRNYRKYTDDGGAARYAVTIDGEDVEASREVYEAYSQGDRSERYQNERDAGRLLSLDRMDEENALPPYATGARIEPAEDTAMRSLLAEQALAALEALAPEDRELIRRLCLDGIPARELARELGVCHRTVIYRRDRALEKLRRAMGE